MDPATRGTSKKKYNIYHMFSPWKSSGDLEKLTSEQAQLWEKIDLITKKRSEDMDQTNLTWLTEAKNIFLQAEILKTEMNDPKQFLIWKQPRGLSDKVANMVMDIRRKLEDADKLEAKLVDGAVGHMVQRNNDQESSSSSSLSLPKNCYTLSTHAKRVAFEIMEAFQDSDVKLIGLVGMGLVGKTTLAILMGKKAKESSMFDEIVKVSGRSSEGLKPCPRLIQSEIAKALGSKWNSGEVGEDSSRASELICGIVKKVKKILIILDDVWEFVDLKAIGIPFGEDHKGCKILLTTRLRDVCEGFGCQKIIQLGQTNEKLKAVPILQVGEQIELGTLPFAITYNSRNYDYEKETARSLELNYNYLNDKKAQSFFLLCSHFPRKYAPTIEELTRYGLGQGLFEDYESIKIHRKKAHSIVSCFRSNLMVEEEEDCVRMCYPFHMLALWIENSSVLTWADLEEDFNNILYGKNTNFFASSTRIFLQTSKFQGYEFLDLKSSNLHTLTIIEDDDDGANFYEDRRFCYGPYMAKLNVLCLQAGCFPSRDWAENPPTLSLEEIKNLKDLQTLQVKGYKLKGISSLVELNKLEILGFLGCTFEDMLPEGLGELHNLKMLDFSYCVKLHEQPQEWVLKLSKLEELYITDISLEVWSRSGFLQCLQDHNSGLNLTVLPPKVNSTFFSQQEFMVPKFSSYWIELNSSKNKEKEKEEKQDDDHDEKEDDDDDDDDEDEDDDDDDDDDDDEKEEEDDDDDDDDEDDDDEEEDDDDEDDDDDDDDDEDEDEEEKEEEVDRFVHFKPICLSKALKIKALPVSLFVELFKDVEYLHLSEVNDCQNIVPSLDTGGLSSLQGLQLQDCKDLKYLIDGEGIGGDLVQVYTFSKLTNLELVDLAKLKSLWKGGEHMINLRNLKSFQLRDCNNFRGYMFSKSIVKSLEQLEILEVRRCKNLKTVFEQCSDDGPICLPKLVTMEISDVKRLQYVFPNYVTEGLPELRELQVRNCVHLKHVFISSNDEVDEKNEPNHCCHLELSQLRLLVLQQVECLKTLCRGKDFIVAPLLEELQVHNCPRLQSFTLTLNNDMLPRLKKLCLGRRVGSKVPKADVAKVYTKMSKWLTSRLHFIIGTRPLDSLGTYFLSNLKELKLKTRHLQVLWKDSSINGLQNLTHLSLYRCGRLQYVFTPLSVHNVPNLKCLSIEECAGLGQIVAEDETTTEAHGQQHRSIWFPNLTDIDIIDCPRLSHVFPARLADQLPKLERLQVVADEFSTFLTQIFGPDRDSKETSNSKVVQLPLLQKLILKDLTNMVRFAPEGLHFTFPALIHLEVRNCTKMQTSFYGTNFQVQRILYNESYQQHVCAITESGEIKRTVDYAQSTSPPVAVPIFSGDNYKPWRKKMMTYFESQDLWEVVEQGTKVNMPPEIMFNEKRKDALALLAIQNGVPDPIYSKIIEAKSARDAWLALEKLYSTIDDAHIRKLFSGNEQEAERWSNAERLEMDGDNNILWTQEWSFSPREELVEIDLTKPDALSALDLMTHKLQLL